MFKAFVCALILMATVGCANSLKSIVGATYPVPEISGASISESSLSGGNTVNLTGNSFSSLMSIIVRNTPCGSLNISSGSNASCVVPSSTQIATTSLFAQIQSFQSASFPIRYSLEIGQTSANANDNLKNGNAGLQGVASCNGHLYVLDSSNHRVLVWNSIPDAPLPAPNVVLGQPDLSTNINLFGGISAKNFSYPYGIGCSGNNLFVADGGAQRVLVWTSIPTTNFAPAQIVLGQPDFTSSTTNNGGISAQSMNSPSGAAVGSDGKLYVTDSQNCRVMVWNAIPTTNFQAADFVLGQANLTTGTCTTPAQNKIPYPLGVTSSGNKILVSSGSNYVLVWNSSPTTNGQIADVIIGQANFTSSSSGVTASTMNRPYGLASDGTTLYVADVNNHRILGYNSVPTSNNQTADFVLGQPDFTSNTASNGGISSATLNTPIGVVVAAKSGTNRLFSIEGYGQRMLMWNTLPTSTQAAANGVWGQTDFVTNQANNPGRSTSGTTLSNARGLAFDGQHLVVADQSHHRVLIWNSLPTTDNQIPDLVLGQTTFTGVSANQGGISASSLSSPSGVSMSGGKLAVADSGNNRVLIWNTFPTTNAQAADLAIGQPNLTSNASNNGGVSATSLSYPWQPVLVNTSLYISDLGNNRVLIYTTLPTASGAAAAAVLGQSSFSAGSAGLSANAFFNQTGIASDGVRFALADPKHSRILVWNSLPTSNIAADYVLGQADFVTGTYPSGVSASTVGSPRHVAFTSTGLLADDSDFNRVIGWDQFINANNAAANRIYGQKDFTSIPANKGLGIAIETLQTPYGLSTYGSYVLISDSSNNRIIVAPK